MTSSLSPVDGYLLIARTYLRSNKRIFHSLNDAEKAQRSSALDEAITWVGQNPGFISGLSGLPTGREERIETNTAVARAIGWGFSQIVVAGTKAGVSGDGRVGVPPTDEILQKLSADYAEIDALLAPPGGWSQLKVLERFRDNPFAFLSGSEVRTISEKYETSVPFRIRRAWIIKHPKNADEWLERLCETARRLSDSSKVPYAVTVELAFRRQNGLEAAVQRAEMEFTQLTSMRPDSPENARWAFTIRHRRSSGRRGAESLPSAFDQFLARETRARASGMEAGIGGVDPLF